MVWRTGIVYYARTVGKVGLVRWCGVHQVLVGCCAEPESDVHREVQARQLPVAHQLVERVVVDPVLSE